MEGSIFKGAQMLVFTLLEHAEKQPETSDDQLEEVIVGGDVLKTAEVQATEIIVELKCAEGTPDAEAFVVPEEVVSEAVTDLAFEVVGEENQATPDVMETDMTCHNLNSIFEDCFYYSTLNQKSPTPLPNPLPKQYPKHTPSPVQQSEPVVESHNLTHII